MTKTLIRSHIAAACLCLTGLSACSHTPAPQSAVVEPEADNSTILLVGLADGSIIRQTLNLDADICMKALNNPTTTCLTRGDAILGNKGMVVGYQMDSETIELEPSY